MFFVAHILTQPIYKDAGGGELLIWENIILIKSDNEKEAREFVLEYGLEQEESSKNNNEKWNGRPVYWKFLGLRDIVSHEDDIPDSLHLFEVSCLEVHLPTTQDLRDYVQGKLCCIRLMNVV